MKTNRDLYREAFRVIVPSEELKEKMLNNINDTNTNATEKGKKVKKPVRKITVIAIAAAIAAVSTVSVFAGVNFYKMSLQSNGKYGETMILNKNTDNSGTLSLKKSDGSEHPEYMKVNLGYLPNGMSAVAGTSNTKYSFNDKNIGGLSLVLYDVSDCDKITDENTDVIDSEHTAINGNDVLYLQYKVYENYDEDNPTFDKSFYMYFKEYDYILYGYVGTDISKEELYKVLDGVTVEPGAADDCFSTILKWEDNDDSKDSESYFTPVDDAQPYSEKYNTFCDIGQSIPLETDGGGKNCLIATVDSVEISDDMSMMDSSFKQQFLDENGKIAPYEVKCYGGGDGVNSLSELQDTKYYDLVYVYETATFTNTSNTDIEDYTVYHYLAHKSGVSINNTTTSLLSEYATISEPTAELHRIGEWVYDDFDPNGTNNPNNPNHITIPAKSSATVHIGYFMFADDVTDDLIIGVQNGSLNYDIFSGSYIEKGSVFVNVGKQE